MALLSYAESGKRIKNFNKPNQGSFRDLLEPNKYIFYDQVGFYLYPISYEN